MHLMAAMKVLFNTGFLLRKAFLFLWPVLIFTSQWELFFTRRLQDLLFSEEAGFTKIWIGVYGLALVCGQVLFPFLISLICLWSLKPKNSPIHLRSGLLNLKNNFQDLMKFMRWHGSLLFRENLRLWGSVLTWSLCFILPGFIRFVTLMAVPFIVTFSNKYQFGQIDAQKYSRQLIHKNIFLFTIIFLTFYVLLPFSMESLFPVNKDLFENPIWTLSICSLEVYFHLFMSQLIMMILKKSMKEDLVYELNVSAS